MRNDLIASHAAGVRARCYLPTTSLSAAAVIVAAVALGAPAFSAGTGSDQTTAAPQQTAQAAPASQPEDRTSSKKQIRLERRSPAYWRVTIDNPPFNIFGPETIPQLNEVITALESDPNVKVVVFDSAGPRFLPDPLQFRSAPVRIHGFGCRSDRASSPSGHAGPPQPCPGGVNQFDPRTRHGRGKRTCPCERYAVRQPGKSHPVPMGGRRGSRSGRRTNGSPSQACGPRACPRDSSWG